MLAIIQRSKTVAKPPFHDHCHLHAHRRITGAVIPEVPWSRSTPVRPSPPPSWCSGPPVTAMRYKGARQGVTTSLTTDLTIDSDWSVGYFSSDLRHEVLWSWLVGWFAGSFVRPFTLLVIYRKILSPVFMKFDTDVRRLCQILLFNLWEVKVKVQGQNYRTENLRLLIARPLFKMSSANLAIRHILSYQKWRFQGLHSMGDF